MKKILLFFTDSYPYGSFEPYIEGEIPLLSKKFDNVLIFPINTHLKTIRKLPKNCRTINIHKQIRFKKSFLLKNFSILFESLFFEYLLPKKNINNRKQSFLHNLKTIYNAICYAKAIKKVIPDLGIDLNQSEIYGYSYWYYQWSLINSILKKTKVIKYAISRAHSYDLYDNINYNVFSEFKIRNLDKIYPVSQHGETYLRKQYPHLSHKIDCNYIGTNDYGINTCSIQSNFFTICSCSAVRDIKRLDIIIKTLKLLKTNIKWIHFGDGPLFKKIQKEVAILGPNVEVQFMGKQENKTVMNFLKNNQIDLFINVSEKEGLPISLVEAISFGIPVIGPKIYGIPEIVNKNTGVLISKDIDIQNLAQIIKDFIDKKTDSIFPKSGIRKFWENNFNREENVKKLFN